MRLPITSWGPGENLVPSGSGFKGATRGIGNLMGLILEARSYYGPAALLS